MAQRHPFSFEQLYNTLLDGFAPIGKGPLGQRASIETQLQYGPTMQALVALGQQTSRQHRQTVRGIRRGGAAAAQSIGEVANQFTGLLGDTPAPTSEAAGRLGLTRDAVTGSLARMQAQQYAGINSGVAKERSQFQQGRQDIVSQLIQAAQKGALYNQGQYAGYAGDAAKAKEARTHWETEQRNALIKAGINPTTGRYDPKLNKPAAPKEPKAPVDGVDYDTYMAMTPAERRANHKAWVASGREPDKDKPKTQLLPNGEKPLSREQHNTLSTSIDYIKSHQDVLKGSSRHDMVTVLRAGVSNADVGLKDSAGKPAKGWYIEPIKNDLAIAAALDLIQFGSLSGGTVGRLHDRGYSIKMLGVPTQTGHKNPYSGRT